MHYEARAQNVQLMRPAQAANQNLSCWDKSGKTLEGH